MSRVCFCSPDSDSLDDESESDSSDTDSVSNSPSMAISLLPKQLANGPPHTLPPGVSPQELTSRILTLCTERLSQSRWRNFCQKGFVALCGQDSVERLFCTLYAFEDDEFDGDISTLLIRKWEIFKNHLSGEEEEETMLSQLSRFSITKIRKGKLLLRAN